MPTVPQWDPQQGDLARQHVLYNTQLDRQQIDPNALISAGWSACPKCGQSWISPENKAQIEATGGYYTCPKCRATSDLLHNLPWHGAVEEDYYKGRNPGGGTSIGIPMRDAGVIGENIVHQLGEIPGYGPITWWSQNYNSPLDGATPEWGIEVKAIVADSASHYWHPGDQIEIGKKVEQAKEMGLKGVLGIAVVLNFRTDKADVYVKPMPLDGSGQSSRAINPLVKWHKRTGEKIASGIPFENPLKDPHNPAPGPYSMQEYYQKPTPPAMPTQSVDPMPF